MIDTRDKDEYVYSPVDFFYETKLALVLVSSTPENCAKLRALGFCARTVTAATFSETRHADRTTSSTKFSRVLYEVFSISCVLSTVNIREED